MKNKFWVIAAAGCFLSLGGLVAPLQAQHEEPVNVLLITVDSLRPDHLGCYGYPKNISPNIDKLAKEGVIFTQAIAQASWTVPAMVSIATSTYPSTHKVYTWDTDLAPELLTLARLLKRSGYRSFFCSGHNKTLSAILGAQGGFEEWTNNEVPVSAGKVNQAALKFINHNYKNKFFLWVHYMDTHDHFIGVTENDKLSQPSFKAADIVKYDAAITQVDEQVGEIIEELKRLNINKNTLIIITADHGEEMCEHGLCFNHGGFLWDSLIRVPLIFTWDNPSVKDIRSGQVQHIDIAPTVCKILKIKPPASFEGQSLLPMFSKGKKTLAAAFSEHQEKQGDIKDGVWIYTKFSVRFNQRKFVYTAYPNSIEHEFYNLENDPGELDNLIKHNRLPDAEKEKFDSLKSKLKIWSQRKKPQINPATKSLDEKTKERLKSLGYLH